MADETASKNFSLTELPENSLLNKNVIKELDDLFRISPPSFLKRSLTYVFFSYLSNTESDEYEPELKEVATDFYLLLKFLDVAEIYERAKREQT